MTVNLLPVSVQRTSSNRKLAPQRQVKLGAGWRRNEPIGPYVASTYVSIAATCPSSCTFKNNGCYVQAGATKLANENLDAAAEGWTALEVIQAEADEIDRLWSGGVPQDGARGGRDLRLHVGGDVSCSRGAAELGAAARRWRERGGGKVWTYTHKWKTVESSAWGPWISVLASCDTIGDVSRAWARGYSPALLVRSYPKANKVWRFGRFTAVPCPVEAGAQTTCATCRLCMDDLRLRMGRLVIAFAEHGPEVGKRHLPVVGEARR